MARRPVIMYADISHARRVSWVVKLFPYMEEGILWDMWSTTFGVQADLRHLLKD